MLGKMRNAHFGIPCKTWGSLHRLFNKGTRSVSTPLGTLGIEAETLGNSEAARVITMMKAQNENNYV